MDKYKALRKMYNDAGVSIYAVKILGPNMSDEEFEYVFNVAEALGCTHATLELPADEAQLTRMQTIKARAWRFPATIVGMLNADQRFVDTQDM